MKNIISFFVVWIALAGVRVFAQTITGPATANAGTTASYTYLDDGVYTQQNWNVVGGSVVSASLTGITYSVTVLWECAGVGTLSFRNGTNVIASKSVTVTCPSVNDPSTTFTYSNQCGATVITRTTSPTGVRGGIWYWQTEINGTRTDLGSDPTLTVTTAGTYYLRARNANATCCWSASSVATQAVTIVAPPAAPAAANQSRCGAGQVSLTASPGAGGTTVRWYDAASGGALKAEGTTYLTDVLSATKLYYAATYNPSTTCEGTRTAVTATVNPLPNAPGATPASLCGPGSISLTATGAGAGEAYAWYTSASGGTALSGTTQSITASTTFYVALRISATSCEGSRTPVPVTVEPVPVISLDGPSDIPYGGTTRLSTDLSYSYQWVRNNTEISGATGVSYVAREPGTYIVRVRNTASSITCASVASTIRPSLTNQPSAVNFESTARILKPGVTSNTSLYTLQPNELSQVVAYMDGLGRAFQEITVGSSPEQTDIVVPVIYGRRGIADTTYLPYATSARDGRLRVHSVRQNNLYSASEQYQFYQQAAKIDHDNYPFSVSLYHATPEKRLKEQGALGADWQPGQGHTVKIFNTVNSANQVRRWKPDGTTSGYYAAKELRVSQWVDEDGNISRDFLDKTGRLILQQVQLDESIQGATVPFLDTYYVYDGYGQLLYILPPKAMAVLGTGATLNAAASTIRELIFRFTYDNKGRVTEKKVPGMAAQYLVYDQLDRPILTQDGNLRNLSKWFFVKYDLSNRPVYTGLYTHSGSRTDLQSAFDNRDLLVEPWYEVEQNNSAYHGYSNQSYPTANLELQTVNYYDHYDFNRDNNADYTYDNAHLTGLPATASPMPRGLATGGKTLILGTTNWLIRAAFYDAFDRVIQLQTNNHLNLSAGDKRSVLYNFAGTTLKTKFTHTAAAVTTNVTQRFDYDHAGRVLAVYNDINGVEQQIAAYEYNIMGQLIDKKLHKLPNASFLQSIDYRYTLHGQLRSINNAQLTTDGDNDEDTDYFGMELLYHTAEPGLNDQSGDKRYWNGNIGAIKWKGPGATTGTDSRRSYKYVYDKTGQLKTAKFQASGTSSWDQEVNTLNETLSYDHNGNIISLVRNRNLRGLAVSGSLPVVTSVAEAIDNLSYTYAKGNKLSKVEDAISGPTGLAGFRNGASAATEYTYDSIGSVLQDQNKGITNILYNTLGKPQQITFSDGRSLQYTYDAGGTKLAMKTLQGGTVQSTTDYVNDLLYEGGALVFICMPEGRVQKQGSNFEYQYAISDHQGNTRVVFSAAAPAARVSATDFETTANSNFQNYPTGGSRSSWELFDHTDAGTAYTASQLLNAGNNSHVGVGKTFQVYPGDKIKIEAYAKYYNAQSNSSSINTFATSLLGAFGLTAPAPGEVGTPASALQAYGGIVADGNVPGNNAFPKAFVNILLFDKDYKFLDVAYEQIDGGAQTGISPKTQHDHMMQEYLVREAGYAYVYISNESPTYVEVYFDDVSITHTPSNILQYSEYYPFGLQTAASWTRDNSKNNFLYNSATELNAVSSWYETPFRAYDPALGRFMQVDALATTTPMMSPYQYAHNNPVLLNDPTGLTALMDLIQQIWDRVPEPDDAGNGGGMAVWTSDGNGGGYVNYYQDDGSGNYVEVPGWGSSYSGGPGGTAYISRNRDGSSSLQVWQVSSNTQMADIHNGNNYSGAITYREFTLKGKTTLQTNSAWSMVTVASTTLAFMGTDAVVPDPTDLAWPKWVVYAAAGSAAAIILSTAGNGNENYPGPLSYTIPAPGSPYSPYVPEPPGDPKLPTGLTKTLLITLTAISAQRSLGKLNPYLNSDNYSMRPFKSMVDNTIRDMDSYYTEVEFQTYKGVYNVNNWKSGK